MKLDRLFGVLSVACFILVGCGEATTEPSAGVGEEQNLTGAIDSRALGAYELEHLRNTGTLTVKSSNPFIFDLVVEGRSSEAGEPFYRPIRLLDQEADVAGDTATLHYTEGCKIKLKFSSNRVVISGDACTHEEAFSDSPDLDALGTYNKDLSQCFSASLNALQSEGTCVESRNNGAYYRCVRGNWSALPARQDDCVDLDTIDFNEQED